MKIVCLLFHSMGWSTQIFGKIRNLSSCQYCYEYDSTRNFSLPLFQILVFFLLLFQRVILFLLLFQKTINEFKEQKLNIKILLHDFIFLVIRHPCCQKMLVMPVVTSCFLHNYFRYTEYHEMEPAKRIEAYKICQVKI